MAFLIADLDDRLVLSRLEELARRLLFTIVRIDDPRVVEAGEVPVAIVVDLATADAIARIGAYRQRWPISIVAATIGFPDQERWHGAVAAGADLVASRGAFAGQLERALAGQFGGPDHEAAVVRLPVRLLERADDGLAGRLPDAPGGSIVLMRLGGRLYAFRDECPHNGASLADGALEGRIITCPRHGSQFDVTTGARERGPSDFPIRTYRVIVDGDETLVEVPI